MNSDQQQLPMDAVISGFSRQPPAVTIIMPTYVPSSTIKILQESLTPSPQSNTYTIAMETLTRIQSELVVQNEQLVFENTILKNHIYTLEGHFEAEVDLFEVYAKASNKNLSNPKKIESQGVITPPVFRIDFED
jgi:hypothetical protein